MFRTTKVASALLLATGVAATTFAAAPTRDRMPDTASLMNAERTAMAPLAKMEGIWRGPATINLPSGKRLTITQTERVGPLLDKTIMMMQGRGYDPDGHASFSALGIMAFNPMTHAYSMNAYAQGFFGTYKLDLTPDGFTWSIPEGPTTMRFTATIKDGTWHEVGERVVPGGKHVRTLEMTLKRVSGTNWPAAGAVPFKQ